MRISRSFKIVLTGITLLIFGAIMSPANATPTEDPNVVYWAVPGYGPGDVVTAENAFSNGVQTFHGFYGPDLVLLCETWYQVDTYSAGHPFGTTVFTLGSPAEDAQWIRSWEFVYGGDCETEAPPEVTPTPEPPVEPQPEPEAPAATPVTHSPDFTG